MAYLCIKAVHHGLNNVHFVFDGEVDEIGIDENVEGWPKGGVVLQKNGTKRSFNIIFILTLMPRF